jgi:hypothetical protein
MGQVCGNVNRNLKWAFVEIGNLVVINQRRLGGAHVVRLYQRIKRAKNHQKAVVAVARDRTGDRPSRIDLSLGPSHRGDAEGGGCSPGPGL